MVVIVDDGEASHPQYGDFPICEHPVAHGTSPCLQLGLGLGLGLWLRLEAGVGVLLKPGDLRG